MLTNYRYALSNGRLAKVDLEGNVLSFVDGNPGEAVDGNLDRKPELSIPTVPGYRYLEDALMSDESLADRSLQDTSNAVIEDEKLSPLRNFEEILSPRSSSFNQQELFMRDKAAIEYSKSLLREGDTLVYVKYPSTAMITDEPHQIHSQKLLATGSKLVNQLPPGIKYVLDLTPPEEGDEAVELTSHLSCSLGIRMWYTSQNRLNIAESLVGGADVVPPPRKGSVSFGETFLDRSFSEEISMSDENLTINVRDKWTGRDDDMKEAIKRSKTEIYRPRRPQDILEVPDYCPFRHRLGISHLLQVIEGRDFHPDSAPKIWTLFVLAKYFDCPQVINDMTTAWLLTYPNSQFIEILPEVSYELGYGLQNPLITRAAFAILVSEQALALPSSRIPITSQLNVKGTTMFGRAKEDMSEDLTTRLEYAGRAFSERISGIWKDLVRSEMQWFSTIPEYQKLCTFEAEISKLDCAHPHRDSWLVLTGNLANDLRHFVRGCLVQVLVGELVLAEYELANNHRKLERYRPGPIPNFEQAWLNLDEEERLLTTFFWKALRGLELASSFSNIPDGPETSFQVGGSWISAEKIMDRHQIATIYQVELRMSQEQVNGAIKDAIKCEVFNSSIMPREAVDAPVPNVFSAGKGKGKQVAELPTAWNMDESNWRETWHEIDAARQAEKQGYSDVKEIPDGNWDRGVDAKAAGQETTDGVWGGSRDLTVEFDNQRSILTLPIRTKDSGSMNPMPDRYAEKTSATEANHGKSSKTTIHTVPKVPGDSHISPNSPFFNLSAFHKQAETYVREVCMQMLDTKEVGIDPMLTDTILSLGPSEFKYLPLWADGLDDNSGGVYEPEIPSAPAGPIGPGPSFHTGFSVAPTTSSEFSFIGSQSTAIGTSVVVADGNSSGGMDRRLIYSDSGHSIGTESFTNGEDPLVDIHADDGVLSFDEDEDFGEEDGEEDGIEWSSGEDSDE